MPHQLGVTIRATVAPEQVADLRNIVKIAIQQVSLAQAEIQSIEVDQFSIGPVTIGQLTLSNVNWESRGQWETWFNENVKPNVPGEIQQEVIELHAVEQP
jgi:hypothetical protein